MTIHKCDLCKKTIKGKMVLAGYSEYQLGHKTFCENCGKPVLDFLRTKGFITEDKSNTKTTK